MVARCAETLSQRYGPSAICSLPLRLDGKVVGVLTIGGKFGLAAGGGTNATLAILANGPNPFVGGNAASA